MSAGDLLAAQASGGIEGANAYMQAQQEIARRRQAAVDAALAEASGRGAPAAAMDATAAAVGAPYDSANLAVTQQKADYEADMARRTGRWNEYAHNVDAARGLVNSVAQGKASVIDAQTKAQLALLQAQRRRSGGGGGGGGGGGSKQKKLSKSELGSIIGDQAASNLTGRLVNAEANQREFRQYSNRARAATGRSLVFPAENPAELRRRQAESPSVLSSRAAQLQARGRAYVTDELAAVMAEQGVAIPNWNLPQIERERARANIVGVMSPREAARMNANEMFQQANQLGLRAMRAMSPDQIRRAYEQERKATVPDYSRREAAAAALERKIRESERTVNSELSRAGKAMVSPRALVDEMYRIATTDPSLLNRYSPADLAELMAPQVKPGESASDYLNRQAGYDPAKAAAEAEKQQKLESDQSVAAASQELGIDLKQLSSSTDVPISQLYQMLKQDDVLGAAINDAINTKRQAADKTAFEEALFKIEQQLDPIQLRIFRAYMGV